jgi:NADP-dependent 3-hydroxy acid dehydrogenase YdfG
MFARMVGGNTRTRKGVTIMDRLEGKVAVITGASTGIDKGTAELFVKEGATVVLTARSVDRLNALAEKIKGDRPGKRHPVPCKR